MLYVRWNNSLGNFLTLITDFWNDFEVRLEVLLFIE
jgi:hypothetical protein